jgi:hypothetical protein
LNAAFNERYADALVAVCDPSIEVHSVFAAIGGAIYHGHDEVRKWLRDIQEAWSQFRVESEANFDLSPRSRWPVGVGDVAGETWR